MITKVGRMTYALLTVLFFCVLFLAINLNRRGDWKKSSPHKAVELRLIEMRPQRFEDVLTCTGVVRLAGEIPLDFSLPGVIESLHFKAGDTVRKGDVIAQLNSRIQSLRLKKAKIELEQYGRLHSPKSLARHEELKVNVDLANSELQKTSLVSPRDGVLTATWAVVGDTVTANQKIATLVFGAEVRFKVFEKEINKIFPGQRVVFIPDSNPEVKIVGEVDRIDVMMSPDLFLNAIASFPNDGEELHQGDRGSLLVTAYEKDDSLFVPNEAVKRTSAGDQVVVAKNGDKAEFQTVEISYTSSRHALIIQGLQPGDRVVSPFPEGVSAGDRIPLKNKK